MRMTDLHFVYDFSRRVTPVLKRILARRQDIIVQTQQMLFNSSAGVFDHFCGDTSRV